MLEVQAVQVHSSIALPKFIVSNSHNDRD